MQLLTIRAVPVHKGYGTILAKSRVSCAIHAQRLHSLVLYRNNWVHSSDTLSINLEI